MREIATEREELETLFREQGDKLWRALVAFTGDPELASEARAEAFAQALTHNGRLRSPAAWVWTSSFRIAKGLLNDRSAMTPFNAEPSYTLPEPIRDLVAALATLPPKQRLALVLHDYADRPTREVAAALGITTGTVLVHLSVARKHLRPLLEDPPDA